MKTDFESFKRISLINRMLAGCLCIFVMAGICGCHLSKPKPPKEKEVVKKVREMINEDIRLIDKVDDEKYIFASNKRDLDFEVNLHASTINIDGADFGYTGDYNFWNNYRYQVYAFYRDRIEQLMVDHGFTVSAQSDPDMPCIDSFTIAAYNWLEDKEIENINAFLKDLRDLSKEEAQYHNGDYEFDFEITFLWIDEWGGRKEYIRTSGNYNYSSKIGPQTTNEELDVRNLGVTSKRLGNVIPPVYNGVLIELEEGYDSNQPRMVESEQ